MYKLCIFKTCFLVNEDVMLMRLSLFFKTYNFAADLKEHGMPTSYLNRDFKCRYIRDP